MKVVLTETAEDCLWAIWDHDRLYSEQLAEAFQRDIDRFIRDAISENPEIGHVWHATRGIRRLIFQRRHNIFCALHEDTAWVLFVFDGRMNIYGERLGSAQAVDDHQPDTFSNKLTARNGQNVRHIESIKRDFKKIPRPSAPINDSEKSSGPSVNRDPGTMVWEDFTHVAGFFPEAPRTGEALNRILIDLGRLLRIRQENLTRGLQKAGAGKLLLIFDYLIARADAIKRPDAYFEKILQA